MPKKSRLPSRELCEFSANTLFFVKNPEILSKMTSFFTLDLSKRKKYVLSPPPHTSDNFLRSMFPDNIIPFEQAKSDHRYPALPMKSELVYKAAEIITDPQKLVNIVSKRVRQLNSGRAPLIPTVPSMGAADIALTEIIEGKIKIAEPTAEA